MRIMDAVLDGPGTAGHPPAQDWLQAAWEAVGSPEYAPGDELVEAALRVATALFEAVFILRDGQTAFLAEVGADSLEDETLEYLVAVETLAEVLEHAAAFLQGAVYSLPRAARHAEALVAAWGALVLDSAAALWGPGDADAAADALSSAAVVVAPLQAELTAAAVAFATTPAPVWTLINDADRRRNAELISAEALTFQVHERVWNMDSLRPLTLVVSGTPVFGNDLVELLQRAAIATDGTALAEETNENEPWSGTCRPGPGCSMRSRRSNPSCCFRATCTTPSVRSPTT